LTDCGGEQVSTRAVVYRSPSHWRKSVPSFDDLALAKDERTFLLSRTRSTSCCVFLDPKR
jgi:hypothetical protein